MTEKNEEKKELVEKDKVDEAPKSTESESAIPAELLELMPDDETPKSIKKIVEHVSMTAGVFSRQHPLADKITEEHVTRLIEASERDNEREAEYDKRDKKYFIINFCLVLSFIVFVIVFGCGSFQSTLLTSLSCGLRAGIETGGTSPAAKQEA